MSSKNRYPKSGEAFKQAQSVLPGGVNSPVRAYRSVGCDPIFVQQGQGATVTDIDDNVYIDYVMSYGPLILGHAPEEVLAAISKAARHGTSFGMPTVAETTLAGMIIDAVESVETVRFVNSGTEATMSAIRLARAATGRNKIIKCTGCYHGHNDGLLVSAGSGATTHGVPSSPGVPAAVTDDTLLVPFNSLDAVASAIKENDGQVACVILEPIAGNMGTIPPADGYLQGLRRICDETGTLLIFDEVMTGFRVAIDSAQGLYGIKPDLSCFGKVIGGGLPCAAYGGRADLMQQVAPAGPMYQAGTLSGNPLAMAAGIATLTALTNTDAYEQLEATSSALATGLNEAANEAGVPVQVARVGSMICCFFSDTPVHNYEQAVQCDTGAFTVFFQHMLENGVVLPPSQYETWFVSTAHDDAAIEKTIVAAKLAMEAVAQRAVRA